MEQGYTRTTTSVGKCVIGRGDRDMARFVLVIIEFAANHFWGPSLFCGVITAYFKILQDKITGYCSLKALYYQYFWPRHMPNHMLNSTLYYNGKTITYVITLLELTLQLHNYKSPNPKRARPSVVPTMGENLVTLSNWRVLLENTPLNHTSLDINV